MQKENPLDKQDQVIRVILNTSLIKMAGFMESFSEVFGEVSNKLLQITKEKDSYESLKPEIKKKLSGELKKFLSETKEQMEEKIPELKEKISSHLTDEVCDECLTLLSKTNLPLPKLNTNLSMEDMTAYLLLLEKEEPTALKLFENIDKWLQKIPAPFAPKE